MNKKRIALSLLATTVFLSGYMYFIVKRTSRADIRLVVEAKFSQKTICRLYVDKDKPQKKSIEPAEAFQEISFLLPLKNLTHVRLSVETIRGALRIRGIKLKSLVRTQEWPGNSLSIVNGEKNPVPPTAPGGEGDLILRPLERSVVLSLGDEITSNANRLSLDRTPLILAGIPLTFLFYLFSYFFSLSQWRLFAHSGMVGNMVLPFFLVLTIPLLSGFPGFEKSIPVHALQEKRVKVPKPEFRLDALGEFARKFTYYYNDHFALRSVWIHINNFIKIRGLGVSPLDKVTLGKDDWLFMAKHNNEVNETEYFRATKPFSFEEMEKWRITLEQRRDWLRSRGIHYLFIMVPNKSTVYPEFMPTRFHKVNKQSRWDQLVNHLREHSTLDVLDLREAMKEARKKHRVYRKGDTHWNQYGAFIAYRNIINALARQFKDLEPMPLSDFDITYKDRTGGDLAIMLSLQNHVLTENVVSLEPRKKLHSREGKKIKFKYNRVRQSVIESPKGKLPTTLMVHDSFTQRLKPYLSEHFSRIIYIRDWELGFFTRIIEKENVKLVIDQTTERFLMALEPRNPEILKKH